MTGLAIAIRECRADDVDVLERELGSGPSRYHAARFCLQERGTATYLVACLDATPVGHLLVRWQGSQAAEIGRHIRECPELNAIGVREDFRSRGIGTSLIRGAEELIARRGFEHVGLAVAIDNSRAQDLYRRLGYRDWGHGEFDSSYPVTREDGSVFHVRERCLYMLRELSATTVGSP